MVVRYVRSPVIQIVIDHRTDLRGNRNRPLTAVTVLDRGVRLRSMGDLQMGCLGVRAIIVDVERVGGTHPDPGFGQYEPGHGLDGRVLVRSEILDDLFDSIGVERLLSGAFASRDVGDVDFVEQALRDRVDGFTPLDENPKRRHLRPLADDIEILPSPHLELVQVASREIVYVVDVLLVAPVDEEAQAGPVALDGRLLTVSFPVVEIHLDGVWRGDRFELLLG